MEPSAYRKKWLELKKTSCSPDAVSQLARQIAFSFIDRCFQNDLYLPEYIDLLCEMATSLPDEQLGNRASSALFEIIVEDLCDNYEDMPVEIYCRVMSQVISYCRSTSAGRQLDERLNGFGISTFEQLAERASFIHSRKFVYDKRKTPRKIILLSRVTIGADVAILSVMIRRFEKIFPEAEIVIIGNAKLDGVFGGNPRIRICPLSYARRGGLFDRFSSWLATLDILSKEMPPESERSILLIDPDSRISQLGVLPFTHSDNYLFFNSRRSDSSLRNLCMAELANRWVDDVFTSPGFCHPTIWTPEAVRSRARAIVESLRAAGCRRIIAVNFGVGANPRKRLSGEFEAKLLQTILALPRTVVLLDRGFGDEELSRSDALLSSTRLAGYHASSGRFADCRIENVSHGAVGMQCDIGQVAALIAECDEFIGYDSACQHIAAAAGTPTLTVFAGSNNMNFVRRWSACGDTRCRIVHVNTLTNPAGVDAGEVIMRVMQERAADVPAAVEPGHRIVEIKPPKQAGKEAEKTIDGFVGQ